VNEQLRVLIVRLGAMGDILHAMPAVTSLRESHPHWFLGWAVEPRWQVLFRSASGDMPLVDRIHQVKAKEWARSPVARATFREIGEIRREFRTERYDVCVDLQGAVRSALVGRLAGAPRMIGEDEPREQPARWLFAERVRTQGLHVIEQALEVCSAVAGEELTVLEPLLPRDRESEAWTDHLLRSEKSVLLSPGAGWGAKRWPAQRYGALAGCLHRAGYQVLVNAGPGEKEIAAQVIEASGGLAQVPDFTLERLIATTRRIRLLIAGDTGPLHLACALGKPVVGIFGPTEPRRNGPFGVPFRVLRHPESKRDHSRRAEPEAGLLTITVDEVFAAAMELL
jgi:lipopolysaccharide heptosyltransferase I